ncbi:hypothetical protein [Methylorubrum extorquens]|uniref:Uncharacterized protein n=1 Tax=Methylorubrum extorquens DSM 13060 TaxID=882800 RepID=H1KCA2_METEX|nr:hypothetical protein [Methylorubrum extorquens]EHP94919.1 hypothetical protein MetexDRAFT_0264 [Methylorubrum extorquens DSM 13060]
MAAKHTPGPWFVGSQNDALFIINRAPRPSTDDINPNHDATAIAKTFYLGPDGGSEDANARLMAAAPDLLAALGEYLVLGKGKCTIGKATADKALAAVRKALGEEA